MKTNLDGFARMILVIMFIGLVLIIHNNVLRERMSREITSKQHTIISNQQKIIAAIDALQRGSGGMRVR